MAFGPAGATFGQWDFLADFPALALAKQFDTLANLPVLALAKQAEALANLPALALAKQFAALVGPSYALADIALRHASSRPIESSPLSRDQARLIVGMFCYILSFLMVLQVVLDVANDTGI